MPMLHRLNSLEHCSNCIPGMDPVLLVFLNSFQSAVPIFNLSSSYVNSLESFFIRFLSLPLFSLWQTRWSAHSTFHDRDDISESNHYMKKPLATINIKSSFFLPWRYKINSFLFCCCHRRSLLGPFIA